MKNAHEYSRRIKQLYSRLKKDGGKATIEVVDDSTRALLMGILANYAGEQRAAAALRKLLEAVVDLNELRVTPVADIVIILGPDMPKARQAGTEIVQVLGSVFNALHHLDISFLKSQPKKGVSAFLEGLDGLSAHAAAFFRNRYLNQGDVPLDENMVMHLRRSNSLPPEATVEEAQKFVGSVFSDRDAVNFYAMFKRFASAHAPRRAAKAAPSAARAKGTKPRSSKPAAAAKAGKSSARKARPK